MDCFYTALPSGRNFAEYQLGMTVTLPPSYSNTHEYVRDLIHFLASPLVVSIFQYHPNYVAAHGPPKEWSDWWDWAANRPDQWIGLVRLAGVQTSDIVELGDAPASLRELLHQIRILSLPRRSDPDSETARMYAATRGHLTFGMSPKKVHEVLRMSAFVWDLVQPRTKHIVDVGAGQVRLCTHERNTININLLFNKHPGLPVSYFI